MMNDNIKMIYSDSEGEMKKYGFVLKRSIGDEVYISDEHFTWCDEDEVYYSDDVDGKYYEEYETEKPFISWFLGRCRRIDFIFDKA